MATGNATINMGTTPVKVTGGIGLGAVALGNVSVTTGGNVNATGVGIETISAGATVINVTGGTTQAGNATLPAIEFDGIGNGTATVTIGKGATVENNVGGAGGLAIQSGIQQGSVIVNDSGTLIGDIDFSSVAPTKGNVSNVSVTVALGRPVDDVGHRHLRPRQRHDERHADHRRDGADDGADGVPVRQRDGRFERDQHQRRRLARGRLDLVDQGPERDADQRGHDRPVVGVPSTTVPVLPARRRTSSAWPAG